MVQLWSCLLLVLASLCAVHTKPYPEAKHRALLIPGYVHFPGVGYYRLAYKTPEVWAEARRNCQQEGATIAVVNSEEEAEALRILYLNYGPDNVERDGSDSGTPKDEEYTTEPPVETEPPIETEPPVETEPPATTEPPGTTEPPPEPANAKVHIGFHDIFIEGEYLTVRGEPIIMTGFVRWKVGHPIADDKHNCGAFDTEKFLLDIPCDEKLPYICEIPEAP